jgi:hypothetical protein
MKVYLNLVFFAFYLITSCNTEQPKEYFPFKSFLTNELNEIDSLPVAILKYKIQNGKTDTSIIEKQQFREIATSLFKLDLQEKKTLQAYKELVLEDTDIDNISIHYTTESKEYPIKQLQLNIKTGTSVVKSFYVERLDNSNDVKIDGTVKKVQQSHQSIIGTIAYKKQLQKNIAGQSSNK